MFGASKNKHLGNGPPWPNVKLKRLIIDYKPYGSIELGEAHMDGHTSNRETLCVQYSDHYHRDS